MVRRGVALGGAFIVLLLLVFGVKGCLSNAKEQALKDYSSDVSSVVRDANENQSAFFDAISSGSDSPADLQTQVNGFRVRAEAQLKQARGFDVPGEMADAQRTLLLALGLIEGGIRNVAEQLPSALASDSGAAERAVTQIAGEMQNFTAADVVYSQRTIPFVQQALEDKDIDQSAQASAFQQNLGWLQPATVAQRLGAQAGSGAGGNDADQGPIAPGSHGHGLTAVSVGDVALQPGGATNRVPAARPTFTVKFANQGDNDEKNVRVSVKVTNSDTGKAVTATKTVPTTTKGAETTTTVPLGRSATQGAATVDVSVSPVRGEQKTDNNSQQYTMIFSAG